MALPLPLPPAQPLVSGPERTKVMLVDDSAVIRGFLNRILSAEPDFEIVASVSDGALAVESIRRNPAQVIILDIEMPNMDGLTAIPLLLQACPSAKIIMASTLTTKNAEASMKALAAGAIDYLSKPSSATEFAGTADFSRELVQKARALGASSRRQSLMRSQAVSVSEAASAKPSALRTMMTARPRYVAIGSSTGGPDALFVVMKHLTGLPQPILITQHMPPTFTTLLAGNITRQCGIECIEGADGMLVQPGKAYVAPGGHHMTLLRSGLISLNQGPQENYCRPAVDVMLRSMATPGLPVLTAILTGMGQDGLKGCEGIVAAGGSVIAQDEATSVVWGMPGMVARAGLCAAVLPLSGIGPKIRQVATRN